MTNIAKTWTTMSAPSYPGKGSPPSRFAEYRRNRMRKPASDDSLEGLVLDGAVQGTDAVLPDIEAARQRHARRHPDHGFIENDTAEVCGSPIGVRPQIMFKADGQEEKGVNSHPLSSLTYLSRLVRAKHTGTRHTEHPLAESGERP